MINMNIIRRKYVDAINTTNKLIYQQYAVDFLDNKIPMICIDCYQLVYASDSTSNAGENLRCMPCHYKHLSNKKEGKHYED